MPTRAKSITPVVVAVAPTAAPEQTNAVLQEAAKATIFTEQIGPLQQLYSLAFAELGVMSETSRARRDAHPPAWRGACGAGLASSTPRWATTPKRRA